MSPSVVLLRGINLGARNRIAMPALREALVAAGFAGVRTYLQSGNIVLDAGDPPNVLAERCRAVIVRKFGLEVPVVVRTGAELARVVADNPLAEATPTPKLFQVCFLSAPLPAERLARLQQRALPSERLVAAGRELYCWHPEGIARSKLAAGLAGPSLGVTVTARNWTTVTTLLEMTRDGT